MQCPSCHRAVPTGAARCPACDAGLDASCLPTEDLNPAGGGQQLRAPLGGEFAPGSRVAERFVIVEEIGHGGMGVVYKAIDTRLDQPVALKIVRPTAAHNAAYLERFKNEVRLARRISHPNVCRVHDLGEAGGILYLSMEWIQGETLQQLLKRAGTLDQGRALEIALKIARALAEAHALGIIHRDLKPDNVMIDEQGDVHVMDFGIATLAESQPERLPGHGPYGTPDYMAPEQRRGEHLDARADLYALGVILREMLTGRRMDPGSDPAAGLRPGTAKGVGVLMQRLLAEDRERRYPSAESVVEALNEIQGTAPPGRGRWKPAAGVAMAGALLIGGLALYVSGWRPVSMPSSPIVPGPTAQSFYDQGLDFLRNESETPKGLGGAIAMLRRAVSEDPRMAKAWAALGEAGWRLFEIAPEVSTREEAAAAVARALDLVHDLPEAHNAQGRGFIATGKYAEARDEFKMAVAARPDFDVAWANLGTACQQIPGGYEEGLAALQKAIALNPTYYPHWVYLGLFHERFSGWDKAAEAHRKAAELNPDSVAPWNNLGADLLRLKRNDEAIEAFKRSFELKESPEAHTNLGTAYFFAKRFAEAAEHYRLAAELSPGEAVYWRNLGDAEMMRDRKADALHAFLRARALARERVAAIPLNAAAHRQLGVLCAKTGDRACALREGARAAELAADDASVTFANAVIRCLLGRPGEALDFLERAAASGYPGEEIDNDPDLRPLHDLPRYKRLLKRAK